MSDVNVSNNEDLGGWFNVSVFSVDEIVSCPDILTNKNAIDIELNLSGEELNFLPIGENIIIRETPRRVSNGFIYGIEGSFEVNIQSPEVDDYFNKYINKKVILIAQQWSGVKRLYGSKKFPLMFTYRNINGRRTEDGQRIQITVSGDIPQKPVYLVGENAGSIGEPEVQPS